MGQAQSVSSKRFQEEYYLFFDEKPECDNAHLSPKHIYPGFGKYVVDYRSEFDPAKDVSGIKLVHRIDTPDVYNVSTHGDFCDDTDTQSRVQTLSPVDNVGGIDDFALHTVATPTDDDFSIYEYCSPSGRRIRGRYDGAAFTDGRITWPDGRQYNGQLKGSVPHGFGTYHTSRGNEYTGHWSMGLQHGEGSYTTYKSGCRIQRRGVWDHGQLVRWLDDDPQEYFKSPERKTMIERIMEPNGDTPGISPVSRATSAVPSMAVSPISHDHTAGAGCSGEDPGC